MEQATLDRLISRYFSQSERRLSVTAGETVLKQNAHNDRLYYVLSGELEGFVVDDESMKDTKVFTAVSGAFIGVHSFFSETVVASSTVIAKTDVELAWIDLATPVVEPDKYGPLTSQFIPVIVSELSRRQKRVMKEAIAKEKALQKLHSAEQMTTLGQLAAGIAHELNNAVGVLSSKTERMQNIVVDLLQELHPDANSFLIQGLTQGQTASSQQVRQRAKELQQTLLLPREAAKELARAVPTGEISDHWLQNPKDAVRYWQIGRDLHDLRLAAKHSVGIVKSVKQLGRMDFDSDEYLDVNQTINKAIALLQSDLRRVSVHLSPATLPTFKGSSTELVQVWANILKNACDAMEKTADAEIEIATRYTNKRILITVSNNGPEIDEATRRKIFQPNFTTKKGGLSFGLGLGLSIVKRIVSGYGGSIAVKSSAEKTIFRIKLPVEE
ncbi:sensor histidine kinase [Vibrio sp. MACH09]|uniref:ATP-binding protein n=1 Tax=Vibrio sp. MACH09 TaxID=3025122 RepID=UPI00278D8654|nr:ATP-binding protein [Vibrio sp. MACH09]GLO61294.1 sensor histidine kinase [Vibrio sp. MACH09]